MLSRDSRLGQRIDHSLLIEVIDGRVDRSVERVDVRECLVGKVMCLQIVPDDLDIIEFRHVFGQPLNGEPVCPGGECHASQLVDVDRSIVLDQPDRFDPPAGHGTVEPIKLFEMRHEIGAALG